MPLPTNLLDPIPGDNPSGTDLRYAPVYDKSKEARREDDTAAQGDWKHEIKKADSVLVIKLAGDAIAKQSKDLQLGAWLTEALLRREGITGLQEGIKLLHGMLDGFWETVYPLMEDGDEELRAAPLGWVGTRLEENIRRIPLTKNGLDYFQYKESRLITPEEAADTDEKRTARQTAIDEGKTTPEMFAEGYNSTSTEFYQNLRGNLDGTLESLATFSTFCDEKFGKSAPSFGRMRTALEEVRQTVRILLEPRGVSEGEAAPEAEAGGESAESGTVVRARAGAALSAEPADRDDAVARICSVAAWLRHQDASTPVPYLVLRGLRWGELRGGGAEINPTLLDAPSTATRTDLKRLSLENSWAEVRELAETARAQTCGRGWLDLQRYVVRACEQLGNSYDLVSLAVRTELRGLLGDFPQLARMTLMDDTPTANPETQDWLQGLGQASAASSGMTLDVGNADGSAAAADKPADAYDLASDAMRSGRTEEAVEILAREASQERSGRGRFQRKIQLASICMAGGYEAVAFPILQDLFREIEARGLEAWEPHQMVAKPLLLLLKCMDKLGKDAEERQKVYAQICRLDPLQALECSR